LVNFHRFFVLPKGSKIPNLVNSPWWIYQIKNSHW
jgi:hypothetical protein